LGARHARFVLAEIHRRVVIEAGPLDGATEAALRADLRPGAKAILDAVARRRGENRAEGQRLRQLLRYESVRWVGGVLHVAGVDEADMSPLAGPGAGRSRRVRPPDGAFGASMIRRSSMQRRETAGE
jgi:ribonuclease HII